MNRYGNNSYAYGNTVRREREEGLDERYIHEVRPQRRTRKHHMSLGYMMFLCTAIIMVSCVAICYVSLRAQITNSVKTISTLESQLNELTRKNDEAYNNAKSNVDLDEIKRIAMEEYGMQYASEDQVISYSDQGGADYVRQKAAIPNE